MNQTTVLPRSNLEGLQLNATVQWLVIGAWSFFPFAAVLVAPQSSLQAYFWIVVAGLGIVCFVIYAIYFGLAEALLVGLVFVTNSAMADPDYLPRVPFLGGNFFFSDYYIALACFLTLLVGYRQKGELLGGYKKHFAVFGLVVGIATLIGLSKGADAHYVLRELHPLVYYPLSILLGIQVLRNPDAQARILSAITSIVAISCVATLWQLYLIDRFQFMTYASTVFGLSQGQMFDAQLVRPPSQWLFLAFLLSAISCYSLWKKNRVLVFGVLGADIICIALGYSRTMFVAIAAGLIALGLTKTRRPLSFLWSSLKTALILVILFCALRFAAMQMAPTYWEAFNERIIGSVSTSLVDSDEPWVLGSRYYEFQMAIEHIKEHPLLGLGIGTAYRDVLPFEFAQTEVRENPEDAVHFMHNTYTYVWMKWGLCGILATGWLVWRFLARSWYLARTSGRNALVGRGVIVIFAGLAIANTVAPGFIASPATPVLIGLMAAFVEACYIQYAARDRGTP